MLACDRLSKCFTFETHAHSPRGIPMKKFFLVIGIIVVCLLVLAIFAVPLAVGGFQPSGQSQVTYNTPKGAASVQWAHSGSKVEYVAFSFDGTDEPPLLITTQSSNIGAVDLEVPGREPRAFPLETNVFEWRGGQFAEQRMSLDREAVSEYCRNSREEFSIADFRAFLAAR